MILLLLIGIVACTCNDRQYSDGNGGCVCKIGFTGPQCECDVNFRYVNNTCMCHEGFAGANCNVCAPSYFGPYCQRCANFTDGKCICPPGFLDGCTECAPGFCGPTCQPKDCGVGICNRKGTCECRHPFRGDSCQDLSPGYYGRIGLPCPECTKGQCDSGLNGTGMCICPKPFKSGENTCNVCAEDTAYGSTCKECTDCLHGKCNGGKNRFIDFFNKIKNKKAISVTVHARVRKGLN